MTKLYHLRFGGDNCFVIESGDMAALVDTGRQSTRAALLSALKPWDIKLILLTHGHFDHCYSAAFLAAHYGAKIAMGRTDLELARDNRIHEIYSRGLVGYFIKKVSVATIRKTRMEPFEPDFYLEDGQDLSGYGIDAQVIALPGHTAGSVGILVGKECIAGDTIMNMGGASRARIAEDFAAAGKSLDRLKQVDAELFYPGHGAPVTKKQLLRL